jgi:uncharacterized protein YprB with RNaseH-like and TPR domain
MSALDDKFSRLAALKPANGRSTQPAELRAPDEVDTLARLLGAAVARNHFGEHLSVRNWFSSPEFVQPSPGVLELICRTATPAKRYARERARHAVLSKEKLAVASDPEKWLFLDTETTGLSGGTGTYAFLVGLAWWDSGGLQVEQFLLRDYSEEHSLLHELAGRIAERPVLVTYNGKTFDWPLLESRFKMTRTIPVPRLGAHLDLLHPARAVWKMRLGSVRLVDIEQRILDPARLGWHRENDVVSSQIPQYYFDYLRFGAAHPLRGVVRHNEMDLRGLAALFGKLNSLLNQEPGHFAEADSLDLFGLSRFLNKRGEKVRAHSACSQALEGDLPDAFRGEATRELAFLAKRQGDAAGAATLWEEIVNDPQEGWLACEQLAMHYERNVKDFEKAWRFAELALLKVHRQNGRLRDRQATERMTRIEEKLMVRGRRLHMRVQRTQASRGPLLAVKAAATA